MFSAITTTRLHFSFGICLSSACQLVIIFSLSILSLPFSSAGNHSLSNEAFLSPHSLSLPLAVAVMTAFLHFNIIFPPLCSLYFISLKCFLDLGKRGIPSSSSSQPIHSSVLANFQTKTLGPSALWVATFTLNH